MKARKINVKKMLAGVLASALTLTAGIFPKGIGEYIPIDAEISVSAVERITKDKLTFVLYDDYAAVAECDSDVVSLEIPSEINGLPVKSILSAAFIDCKDLQSVIIPYGVESIEIFAFQGCSNLIDVSLPLSVIEINSHSFENTPWLELKKAENPLVIVNSILLDGTNCEGNIVVPDNVKAIANDAFDGNLNIKSISIPGNVKSIGNSAFFRCKSLSTVIMSEGVVSIGGSAFMWSNLTNVKIPSSITSIGSGAFYDTPWLKARQDENPLVIINSILIDGKTCKGDVMIPNSVKAISDTAFSSCNEMTSITVPSNVISLGRSAFSDCKNLITATLNCNIKILSGTFSNCPKLKNVTLAESVVEIGYGTFTSCSSLESIVIPNNVEIIDGSAFYLCSSLKEVSIPESVTNIGGSAFFSCKSLKSITINNPNCEIYDSAETISSNYDNELKSHYFNGTIYGYKGSTAEKYAQKYNYNFKEIGSSPSDTTSKGDFNGDGKTDLEDVIGIYKYIQLRSSYGDLTAGDYNGDGMINMFDAIGIAKHILENDLYDKNSTASGKVCAGSIYADDATSMSFPLYIDNEYSNGVFIKIKCPDGFTLTDISDALVDDLKTGKAIFASGSSYKTYTPFTELKFDIAESVPYGTYDIEIEVLALDNNGSCGYGGTIAKEIIKYLKGDISGNGKIDIFDAVLIAQYTVGKVKLTPEQFAAADYNGDKKVDIFDAVKIAQFTVGKK